MGRPTQHIPHPGPQPDPAYSAPPGGPPPKAKRRFSLRNPLSIALIIVIVLALIGGALIGAEWYARNAADEKIQQAAACKMKGDGESTDDMLKNVKVTVATTPPVLWQYLTDNYTKFTIITRGDHIRSAQGMTADIVIQDLKLDEDANKEGTVGSVRAKINWTSDGIRETLNGALEEAVSEAVEEFTGAENDIPDILVDVFGADDLVTAVETDASAGTVTVTGELTFIEASLTVKPVVENGDIRLVIPEDGVNLPSFVTSLSGEVTPEDVQPYIDEKTKKITENELNIKADSIEVTNDGVVANFSTQNADILKDDGSDTQGEPDECDL